MTPHPLAEWFQHTPECQKRTHGGGRNMIRASLVLNSCRECTCGLDAALQRDTEEREQNQQWRTWGIIEIAVRNVNVASYMTEWEGRAINAEARLAALEAGVREVAQDIHSLNEWWFWQLMQNYGDMVWLRETIRSWATRLSALLPTEPTSHPRPRRLPSPPPSHDKSQPMTDQDTSNASIEPFNPITVIIYNVEAERVKRSR